MSDMPRLSIGHIGMFVTDPDRMKDFYTRVLGFTVTDDGRMHTGVRLVFMSRDPSEHHQVVLVEGRGKDAPTTVNQISFRVQSLADIRAVHRRVVEAKADDIRPINHGNAWSVYFRDPEGNRLECYLPTPWYVEQPHGDPMDLSLSDQQIHAATEAMCRKDPSFMPVEEWRKAFAHKRAAAPA